MLAHDPPTAGDTRVQAAPLPVSVVIAAYNRAEMLQRAIGSVLAQRPAQPAEIVVVDDASTDATADVARALGARVVRHPVNRGEGGARNTAIGVAGQPWLAILDSDDEWLPWHLDNLWQRRADHAVVSGSALRCGEDPTDDRLHGPPGKRDRVLTGPADILFGENVVPASGVMFRRDVMLKAGCYDETLPKSADLDVLVRCLEHGTGVATPALSVIYHVHPGQVSADSAEMWASHTSVAERYRDRSWWSSRRFNARRTVEAWDTYRAGGGARHLGRALLRPDALARLLWSRFRIRRRTSRVGRDGRPSVALMPGAADGTALQRARVMDLRGALRINAYARLAREPTGEAVSGSRVDQFVLRTLRIHAIAADR